MRKPMWVMPVFALATGLASGGPAAAEPEIGAVALQEYRGAVGTRIDGDTRDLLYQETVYADERVDTRADGATNLVFLDQTNLYVGELSSVVLDRFVYDPASQQGDVAISFAKGAFRFVTGQIRNKDNVSLRTPTASMVIRGTTLVLFVLPDGTSEINVEDGAVDVFVCEASDPVALGAGQSLLVSSSCEGTLGQARDPGSIGFPIPGLPTEYAQLLEIQPAAGEETTEQTASTPDWVRGRRSDHERTERSPQD